MAVYKDKKRGTWYALIRYTDDEGNPKSKMKRGFELKRDAINYEHEFRQSLKSPKDNTYSSVFEDYLSSLNSKSETKQNIIQKHNAFLKEYENNRLSSFRPKKILNIIELIKNSDYSKSYKNYALMHFKAVLRFAKQNYDINTRYELIKKIPKDTNDHIQFDTWTDEEFNQFIKSVEHVVYRSLFIVLYRTGLRRGEALALEYNDLQGNTLKISKSYRRKKDTLKNVSSYRTILLDNLTIETLNNLKVPHGYLFFGGDNYLSLSQIDRYFKQGIKKSKVKPIRLHDLRHSHATNLINKGANIVAVSKRLGHSDIKMTIHTYTKILEKTDEELIKLI